MSWPAAFVAAQLLGGAPAHTFDQGKWNTVELLCGKLIQVTEVPVKDTSNSFTEKQKPIKNANLRLYQLDKNAPCCTSESLTAETISRKDGSFDFKNIVLGPYWIVIHAGGTDYKLALSYAPNNKNGDKCPDQLYEIKNGELQLSRIIQVD